jgi:hypothetical protein
MLACRVRDVHGTTDERSKHLNVSRGTARGIRRVSVRVGNPAAVTRRDSAGACDRSWEYDMSASVIGGIMFVCAFGCALLGMVLGAALPPHHLASAVTDRLPSCADVGSSDSPIPDRFNTSPDHGHRV